MATKTKASGTSPAPSAQKLRALIDIAIAYLQAHRDPFRRVWDHPDTLNTTGINAAAAALGLGPLFSIGEAPAWWSWPNLPPDHPNNTHKVECLTVYHPDGLTYQILRENGALSDDGPLPAAKIITYLKEWAARASAEHRDFPPTLADAARSAVEPIAKKKDQGPAAPNHSDDFRSIDWFGTQYVFTPKQAVIVKMLWENWERGTPIVGKAALVTAAESAGDRIDSIFRGHPSWQGLIESPNKGVYQLKTPELISAPPKKRR